MTLARIRAEKKRLAPRVGDDVKRATKDILDRYASDFRKLANR